ncbi:MAG: regulatory P domain-containing protein, partial [Reinekea sp.]|nr:regulatory P domain-containing protein [Reinekea sp.]
MNNWIKRTTLGLSAVWLSSYLFGHSSMFPDGFEYDDTLEGSPASSELLLDSTNAMAIQNAAAATACTNGTAGTYPCKAVDLMSFVAKGNMGGGSANLNDIWGYTDPVTGDEIAIVGRTNGTSFVN